MLSALSFEVAVNAQEFFPNIQIDTLDSGKIHAHKEILSIRCPILLKKEGKSIVEKYESKVVLSLLHYLYSDEVPSDSLMHIDNLKKLSQQLNLQRLEFMCQVFSKRSSLKTGRKKRKKEKKREKRREKKKKKKREKKEKEKK